MDHALLVLSGLLIDAALGWPPGLYVRISHPVVWIGTAITALESWLNGIEFSPWRRRLGGIMTLVLVAGGTFLLATATVALVPEGWPGMVVAAILCWPLIAARSLHDHVAAVARPLAAGDLAAARMEVGKIVGRDPQALDEAGIASASLESLAENTSDGIIAPLFWGVVLGFPGMAAYKAINTLDSMIGHRSARYQDFGWASARFDDVVNLVPARLTGLMIALVSARPVEGWRAMQRDAPKHRSPNAGWPEAAMADALGVRLSGPRSYGGAPSHEPYVNGSGRDPEATDIAAGLALYRRVLALSALVLAIGALF